MCFFFLKKYENNIMHKNKGNKTGWLFVGYKGNIKGVHHCK